MAEKFGDMHIVFTDNSESERLLFSKIVGYLDTPVKCTVADSGAQLFEILNTANPLPDLIFLDYYMPVQNGMECLVKIRSIGRLCQIPVIIYSDIATEIQVNTAYNNGADFYVRKVQDIDDLTIILKWFIWNKPKQHSMPPRENFLISASGLSKQKTIQ